MSPEEIAEALAVGVDNDYDDENNGFWGAYADGTTMHVTFQDAESMDIQKFELIVREVTDE